MHIDNITSEKMTLNADGKSMQISIYEKNIEQLQQENQELKKQLEENQNPLRGIFAQVNDDTLLRDCGNMNAIIELIKDKEVE